MQRSRDVLGGLQSLGVCHGEGTRLMIKVGAGLPKSADLAAAGDKRAGAPWPECVQSTPGWGDRAPSIPSSCFSLCHGLMKALLFMTASPARAASALLAR